jgi:hypothetical protein
MLCKKINQNKLFSIIYIERERGRESEVMVHPKT